MDLRRMKRVFSASIAKAALRQFVPRAAYPIRYLPLSLYYSGKEMADGGCDNAIYW